MRFHWQEGNTVKLHFGSTLLKWDKSLESLDDSDELNQVCDAGHDAWTSLLVPSTTLRLFVSYVVCAVGTAISAHIKFRAW